MAYHSWKCAHPYQLSEMQMKTTTKYYFTVLGWKKIKNFTMTSTVLARKCKHHKLTYAQVVIYISPTLPSKGGKVHRYRRQTFHFFFWLLFLLIYICNTEELQASWRTGIYIYRIFLSLLPRTFLSSLIPVPFPISIKSTSLFPNIFYFNL